jgi:hypothetical protein
MEGNERNGADPVRVQRDEHVLLQVDNEEEVDEKTSSEEDDDAEVEHDEDDDDDENDDDDDDEDDDEGSVGSLVDFIASDAEVDDVEEDVDEAAAVADGQISTSSLSLKRSRDDGIEEGNIIEGKRQRRSVNRYVPADMAELLMEGVPIAEVAAVFEDVSPAEIDEEEVASDSEYVSEDVSEDIDDDDDDEDDDEDDEDDEDEDKDDKDDKDDEDDKDDKDDEDDDDDINIKINRFTF